MSSRLSNTTHVMRQLEHVVRGGALHRAGAAPLVQLHQPQPQQQLRCLPSSATLWSLRSTFHARLVRRSWRLLELPFSPVASPLRLTHRHLTTATNASGPRPHTTEAAFEEALLMGFTESPAAPAWETTSTPPQAAAKPVAPPLPSPRDAADVTASTPAPQSSLASPSRHGLPLRATPEHAHAGAEATAHDGERAEHQHAELAFEEALLGFLLSTDAEAHDPPSNGAVTDNDESVSASVAAGAVAARETSMAPPPRAAFRSEKPSAATPGEQQPVLSDRSDPPARSASAAAAEAAFEEALYGGITSPSPAPADSSAATAERVPSHKAPPSETAPHGFASAAASAAEVAFEQALYGSAEAYAATAGEHDVSEAEAPTQTDPTGSDAPRATTSPSAALAFPKAEVREPPARGSPALLAGGGGAEGHTTMATTSETPTRSTGEGKRASSGPMRQPSVAEAEAAFERALYGDFTRPGLEPSTDAVAAQEAGAAAASVPDVPTAVPPLRSSRSSSFPTTAPQAAVTDTPAAVHATAPAEGPRLVATQVNHATAEAAFERALYGDLDSATAGADTVVQRVTDPRTAAGPLPEASETHRMADEAGQQRPPLSRPTHSPPARGTPVTSRSLARPTTAVAASSEAAFEDALYGGAHLDARVVPAEVTAGTTAAEEMEDSDDEPALAFELDSEAAGDGTAGEETGSAGIHATTPSTGTEVHHEEVEGTRDGEDTESEASSPAEYEAEALEEEELPPPPPTVSMHCAFALDHRAASVAEVDHHTLADALFGTTDHHTSAVTHVEPEVRVAECMPLLGRLGKRELFYGSEWLLRLEASEAELGDSAAPPCTHREVVGRSKVLRSLMIALLERPDLWWDGVEETVLLAVHATAPPRVSQGAAVTEPSASTAAAGPSSTTRMGGPAEVVVTAAEVQAAVWRVFGPGPKHARLFSDAVTAMLLRFATALDAPEYGGDTEEETAASAELSRPVFTGPVAAWNAFVLTQRHRACGVCAPHRRPFSFGERYPTLTAADLAPLQFNNTSASWGDAPAEPLPPSLETRLEGLVRSAKPAAEDPSAEALGGRVSGAAAAESSPSSSAPPSDPADRAGLLWGEMTEEEQNTFLFGADSARLLSMVRGRDGVYAVYGSRMLASETSHAAENAEPADASGGPSTSHTPEARAALSLTAARDAEAATMRAYEVDRVVLALTNPEGVDVAALPGGRPAYLAGLAAASRSPAAEARRGRGGGRGRGGRGRARGRGRGVLPASSTAHAPFQLQLQNCEDVQLAALWQGFTLAHIGDLVSNLAYVRQRGAALVREAVVDVAVQKAFWLHFFARDEVRAITDPRRTYETVWRLHHQLRSCVAPLRQGETLDRAAGILPPPFDALALDCQVTYACFGMAHVPPRGDTAAVTDAPTSDEAGALHDAPVSSAAHEGHDTSAASSRTRPLESPVALYTALLASYMEDMKTSANLGDIDATAIKTAASTGYTTLSSLQRLAVGFCFSSVHWQQPRLVRRPRAAAVEAGETESERESVTRATAPRTLDDAGPSIPPDAATAPRRRRGRPRKTAAAKPVLRDAQEASEGGAAASNSEEDACPLHVPRETGRRVRGWGNGKEVRVTEQQQRQARNRRVCSAQDADDDGVTRSVSDEDVARIMALFGRHQR